MAVAKSAIEWTDSTWSPVTGCDKVSPGCDHCYAETIANRFAGNKAFPNGFAVTLHPDRLDQPLRWKKPRRVFVNSMSDLFHEAIPDEYIAKVFAVMLLARRHTFQVLTKRHGRMRSLLNDPQFLAVISLEGLRFADSPIGGPWPLPNVWLGVSVEDQKWADIRIPALLATPAAVRWISAEPLLGPVDLTRYLYRSPVAGSCVDIDGNAWHPACQHCQRLDWVVVGGESGPGARPMHPDWARGLRDQCTSASVPFFFKQHGEWQPIGPLYGDDDEADDARMDAVGWEVEARKQVVQLESTGHVADGHQPTCPRTWLMVRRGKKAAGRELDGRTWDEYPS